MPRWMMLAVITLGACALESGESSAGIGGGAGGVAGSAGASGTGGDDNSLEACVASAPNAVPITLGTTCTPCLCADESDRATVVACDSGCWQLILCVVTFCNGLEGETNLQCILDNCAIPASGLGPPMLVSNLVLGCDAQCQLVPRN